MVEVNTRIKGKGVKNHKHLIKWLKFRRVTDINKLPIDICSICTSSQFIYNLATSSIKHSDQGSLEANSLIFPPTRILNFNFTDMNLVLNLIKCISGKKDTNLF